ncbi:MAG: lipid A biosynthesis acyltransferase [Gammaproteobacteria bacterium]
MPTTQNLQRFRSTAPRFQDYPLLQNLTGWLLFALVYTMRFIPMRLSWLLGSLAGSLAALLYKTNTIAVNLALCFPRLSEARRRQLRRQYFRRLGQAFFNLGLAWTGSPAQVRRHVRLVGGDHVNAALAAGQGVILLAPHMVGLELGFKRVALEWPSICMYRKPRSALQHQLSRYFRTGHGGMCLERYENMKPLVKLIREDTLFYYLPDQDPDHAGKDYVFAPFFAQPAATFTALSRLARLGHAVVIPLFTRQLPYGAGYEVQLLPPLQDFPGTDDVADATAMNQAIAQGLRHMPEQYFWSYRRFKTQPEGMASPYQST